MIILSIKILEIKLPAFEWAHVWEAAELYSQLRVRNQHTVVLFFHAWSQQAYALDVSSGLLKICFLPLHNWVRC
jgi:hypothetical protein